MNIPHVTTFLNLLCLALLGLHYHEDKKLHQEHGESIASINKHLSKHQESIANLDRRISKHETDISNINSGNFKHDSRQRQDHVRSEEENIILRDQKEENSGKSKITRKSQQFEFPVTDEDKTLPKQLAEIEKILSKDILEKTPSTSSRPKRKAIQVQTSDNIETKCLLMSYSNSTFIQNFDHAHSNTSESSIMFDLTLNLTTDGFPQETSWSLSPRGEDAMIIDSHAEGQEVELFATTSHTMVYSCVISSPREDVLDKSKICYEFEMQDSGFDGICCTSGLGSFSLTLNNNDEEDQLFSGRFYGKSKHLSFCLEDDDDNTEYSDTITYTSKECLHENCICDSKPNLLSNFDDIESKYSGLHELKSRTMMNILILSGGELLQDKTSPQYQAACWTLNDDPHLTQYSNTTVVKASDAEKRMLQRYILAVLYFSTNPQNWKNDYSFLSSKSECDWNSLIAVYISGGVGCDESENIISFLSFVNNLEGTIVNELSGLKSLESLILYAENLHGTLPISFGRLSELKNVVLGEMNLEGTLAPEFFSAEKLEYIIMRKILLTGSIPHTIGNSKGLQYLDLSKNLLTGSLPEDLFSLTDLRNFYLYENMLSSSISSSIGNLRKMSKMRLYNNNFTGQLPSQLGYLTGLRELNLSRNRFSGTIPSSIKSLISAERIDLFETELKGEVPDEMCEIEPPPSITADCRNDIFPSELECSCCSYCADKTPVWDGDCPDVRLKINIDHVQFSQWFSTELLQWSISDTATNKKIIGDGPYIKGLPLTPSYETCIASSDCLILNMMADPLIEERYNAGRASIDFKTNYSIYWNDKLVFKDTFEMDIYNETILPEVTFQYDESTDQILVGSSCAKKEMICSGESILLNPMQRVMYNSAFKISGTAAFDDVDSPHSKALCWIIRDSSLYDKIDISEVQIKFTQRYVLALLHLTSVCGLFGDDELPPSSHECSWEGVTCDGEKNIMTSLSLSSASKQIIGGTLIQEIGNLAFLEILQLNQTELEGPIPYTFHNLYSLKKLDLSENILTGTISENFFNQLRMLELFDLSNNDMSGEVPVSIGSCSNIKVIRLNRNRFTGLLPLDSFTTFSLRQLDMSVNQLSGSISPSLLKHRSLEYLDLGDNFFVGSIEEAIFDELINLNHFDVSKNTLVGIIPPLNQNSSNITHFDIHDNKFTGTLPISLSEMTNLKYLYLQGNEITGSIPFELNKLENLHSLRLSHNQLKGSIPLTFDKLPKLDVLSLHANQLSGKAPITNKGMTLYITDCGYPAVVSSDPIDCPSCSICCNSENLCSRNTKTLLRPVMISVIFFLSLLITIAIIFGVKKIILNRRSIKKRFEESVVYWKASDMIGDKSVYHFFLTDSKKGWYVGLFCALAQLATLFLFIIAADIANEGSDLQYTLSCSADSIKCDDEKSRTIFGGFIFSLIISIWLLKDLVGSIKLFLLALWQKNIDFFFASMVLFLVTALSAWTSVYYNLAIATKDTELIVNAVILLFINELDERLYKLCRMLNFSWTSHVDELLKRDSNHESQKLNVFRAVNKMKKRFRTLSSYSLTSFTSRKSIHLEEAAATQENQDRNSEVSEDPLDLDLDLDMHLERTILRDASSSILDSVKEEAQEHEMQNVKSLSQSSSFKESVL